MRSWTIPVQPLLDESLSSWLTRAALRQGCDPMVLTGVIWPHRRVWITDPDRGFTKADYEILSTLSGVKSEDFAKMALSSTAERIAGYQVSKTIAWPWILALGSRNRLRHGGQQFCPVCFGEDKSPYYRKQWRYAWHTACPFHKIALADRCDQCGSPIEPHRLLAEDKHLAQCARCKFDLRLSTIKLVPSEMLQFQESADSVLCNNRGLFGKNPVNAAQWFLAVRLYCGLIRRACQRKHSQLANMLRIFDINVNQSVLPQTRLALELLSIEERQKLLIETYKLYQIEPDKIRDLCQNAKISINTLFARDFESIPAWLRDIFKDLPKHAHKKHKARIIHHKPATKQAVMESWARFQRKMMAGA